MSTTERYEKLIMAALRAQQLKKELSDELRTVSENLTAYEIKHRSFDNEAAHKAFLLIADSGVEIEPTSYASGELLFKDVKIYLYEHPSKLRGDAVKQVLTELRNSEIFG